MRLERQRRSTHSSKWRERRNHEQGNHQPPAKQHLGRVAPAVAGPGTEVNVNKPALGTRLLAEVVGTFMFFFLGFSGIAAAVAVGGAAISPLGIAFGFGLGLALAITAFGHISGGHFNPAVTAGLALARRHPTNEVVQYWVAQLVGGFLAVVVQAIVFSSAVTDALDTNPGVGISDWGALVLEIVVTALFLMVILTVATDTRAPWKGVMAPLSIGLFIFTAAATVGPTSGGSFNPARSLDPVLWNQDWGNVWIYLVGPLAGGVLGAAIWVALVGSSETSLVGKGSET